VEASTLTPGYSIVDWFPWFSYLFTASGHMDITCTDRFTVLLGFICSPQMIYAETRTCILSVIQCSTVQSLLLKCNFSSSLQSVFVSFLISQECKQVEKDSPYYDFHYNTRRARPSIVHFQVWFSSVALQSKFLSKVIINHVVYGFVWFEEWFVLGRLVHHEACVAIFLVILGCHLRRYRYGRKL